MLADIWGECREFQGKNSIIKLYPIKLKDIDKFYNYVSLLQINKNNIADASIIKMSYLKFILEILKMEGTAHSINIHHFTELLEMVFQEEVTYLVDARGKDLLQVGNDKIITENDFEAIRKIICDQNLVNMDLENVSEEMAKVIKETREFLARKNESATLEEQIVIYHCFSAIPYADLKDYTIYQFSKGLERYAIIKNFEVFSSLMAEHGKGNEIAHFLSHVKEKRKYEDITLSQDKVTSLTKDNGGIK